MFSAACCGQAASWARGDLREAPCPWRAGGAGAACGTTLRRRTKGLPSPSPTGAGQETNFFWDTTPLCQRGEIPGPLQGRSKHRKTPKSGEEDKAAGARKTWRASGTAGSAAPHPHLPRHRPARAAPPHLRPGPARDPPRGRCAGGGPGAPH